jgi:predicted transcriptional regulator
MAFDNPAANPQNRNVPIQSEVIVPKDELVHISILSKRISEIDEVIDIILQKHIILVPVINDEQRLIGVVSRLDILRQNINEKFVTIGRT